MTQLSQPTPLPEEEWPEDWFERANHCHFCGSHECRPFIDGVRDWFFHTVPGEFAYDQCMACHSLVLTTRPDTQHIGQAYANYYTHLPATGRAASANPIKRAAQFLARSHVRVNHGTTAHVLDKVLALALLPFAEYRGDADAKSRFLPRTASTVLDYGCGNGDFLARARELGHTVVGVDFDPEASSAAAERGIEVLLPSQVDSDHFAGKFDMITAAHVLEHVADPVALLRDFAAWLKPGGRVFIELPNAQAGGLRRYGRFWRGLEAPRHFAIPSLDGLTKALATAGFRIEEMGAKSYEVRELWSHSQAAMDANPGVPAGTPDIGPDIGPATSGSPDGNELLICVACKL